MFIRILSAFLICLSFACSSTQKEVILPQRGALTTNANCFNIVHGQSTSAYPEVTLLISTDKQGKIMGTCTGTFIGPKTVITAAHCITANETIGISRASRIYANGSNDQEVMASFIPATKVLNKDPYINNRNWTKQDARADVAILIFSQTVAPAVAPIIDRQVNSGEEVTVVGFGMDKVDPSQASLIDSKQFGFNTLNVESFGLAILSPYSGGSFYSKNTGTASGDSGGPLFVDGKIAGVLSGGGPSETNRNIDQSAYADLNSASIQSFIQDAISQGADITTTDASEKPSAALTNDGC